MFLRTFTFKLSSVSSSSITRQVHGFVVKDSPPADLVTSSLVFRCLSDFLLNARGPNFDKTDSIAVSLILTRPTRERTTSPTTNATDQLWSPQNHWQYSLLLINTTHQQCLRVVP